MSELSFLDWYFGYWIFIGLPVFIVRLGWEFGTMMYEMDNWDKD